MVLHFLDHSNSACAMARHFDIEPSQVCDWRSKKDKLKTSAPHLLKIHKGRNPYFSDLEQELAKWIMDCWAQSLPITRNMAVKKARELAY